MAIGASQGDVQRMILRQAAMPCLLGTGLGGGLTAAGVPLVSSMVPDLAIPIMMAAFVGESPSASGGCPTFRPILVQFAKGDQNAVNPGTTAIIREGDLADCATFYRNDLAIAASPGIAIPKNPHLFVGQPTSPIAIVREIALGAQEQIAVFFASAGTTTIRPAPLQCFEAPIAGPLPETLDFIR